MRTFWTCLAVALLVCVQQALAVEPAADARHRFANEPRLEAFRQSVIKELDGWLEGMGGDIVGWRREGISHLADTDAFYWPNYADGILAIEWNTGTVRADFKATGRDVTFAWVLGTRPRPSKNPLRLLIDGQKRFEFPISTEASWKVEGLVGGQFRFDSLFEDAMKSKYGYARVTIPDKWLTPGKPLRMRLEADMVDSTVFPRTFSHTDAVAELRAGPRSVFIRLVAGIQPNETLRLSVAARPTWDGKQVELHGGGKALVRGRLALADDKKIAEATLLVPRSAGVTPEMAKEPFIILVDGKPVDRASISPVVLTAPALIDRYHQVADAVRRGQVKEKKLRDAATAGGAPDVELIIVPNADHVYKRQETPFEQLGPEAAIAYNADDRSLEPAVVSGIVTWLRRVTVAP